MSAVRSTVWLAPLLLVLGACGRGPVPEPTGVDLAALLSSETVAGFAPVDPGTPLRFPDDHGPHPEHRIEWWYYTANLAADDGEAFGVQVALFRLALRPGQPDAGLDAGQVFMAHVSVGELDAGRFHFDQRVSRPLEGLAGARAAPFAAWVEACSVRASTATTWPKRVHCPGTNADGEPFAVELVLEAGQPRVLHGQAGYSRKSDAPGAASFYYSYTRQPAQGRLHLPGREAPVAVQGLAWMDHEWGSVGLAPGQVGWDWMSLRLDDGVDWMLFHIRNTQGQAESQRGSRIGADGSVEAFAEGVVQARPVRWWRSPHTGIRWPVAWDVRSPEHGLDLHVEAALDDQELRTAVIYWEGAVTVRGTHAGRPVSGQGFLELTGYRAGDAGTP